MLETELCAVGPFLLVAHEFWMFFPIFTLFEFLILIKFIRNASVEPASLNMFFSTKLIPLSG